MFVVGATYIYSGSNNERESANIIYLNNKKTLIMNTNYRYQLENKKLTGKRQQKFTCPQCGRKKCFVRYIDTRNGNQYVADEVGKCDHQHSCGYHYTPGDYYRDHPGSVATLSQQTAKHVWTPPPLPPFRPLSMAYVTRSHSPQSTFFQWMTNDVARRLAISPERLRQVYDDYMLGATRQSNVIFWQIDHLGQVHGGHIMQYHADGHRGGYQCWTHVKLIRDGLLPQDWQLYQCLYGQHLLSRRPDDHVCIVESEKTALIMAACQPKFLWLATAGSGGLSPEKVQCLQGRRVTLFPDSGCYDKWSRQMQQTSGINYNVDRQLESYPPNTDLCDVLLDAP